MFRFLTTVLTLSLLSAGSALAGGADSDRLKEVLKAQPESQPQLGRAATLRSLAPSPWAVQARCTLRTIARLDPP